MTTVQQVVVEVDTQLRRNRSLSAVLQYIEEYVLTPITVADAAVLTHINSWTGAEEVCA